MPDDHDELIAENRRRLGAVTLHEGTHNGVWSRLSAHIDAEGRLVVSGHNLGPGASLIGDELEYWIKVEERHLERVAHRLRQLLGEAGPDGKTTILVLLKAAFDGGEFESAGQLVEWLEAKRIPSSWSSWP